jgi:hypothetical protein
MLGLVPIEMVFEVAKAAQLIWPYSAETSPEKVLPQTV